MKNPIQPLAPDQNGTLRFKRNAIVEYLLKAGGIDLNHIAAMDFTDDDRQQFSQLIGYSLGGYCSLSHVDADAAAIAMRIGQEGVTEEQARMAHLQEELDAVRNALRAPVARLYGVHPDDLGAPG